MWKKMVLAGFALVIAVGLATPPKAEAQVIGVQIGVPVVTFQSGYHDGYYYDNGYRYQRDARGFRHYDHSYGGHDWRNDRDHRDGNHHDEHHPDGDHRDWKR